MTLNQQIYDEVAEIMIEDKGNSIKIHFLVKEIHINPKTFQELYEEEESIKTITYDGELKLFGFPLIVDKDVEDWVVITK